jgi:hypothetical protein
MSLYVDGALNGSAISPTAPINLSGIIRLGQYGGGGSFYHGLADELRISNTARSPAWIQTEFSSQSSPGTFFSLGVQQSVGGGGTVATPTFNPPAGTYSSAQPVTISSATAGASIYYTTNGTAPSTSSTLYTGPVNVSSSLTLNAIGHLSGMTDSAVGSAAYVINSGGPGWYNVGGTWAHRKTVTIDHTKVSAALSNFPVLVSLASDANLSAGALANGNDILFTASDGTTKLDHEIEIYTSASGQLIAWVRVPALSSSADTVLYLYYGNPASANQQHAPGVWDSNFASVLHLGNGTTLSGADSTSNASNGTLGAGLSTTAGKIDGGASFNATGAIDMNNSAFSNVSSALTVEFWTKYTVTGQYLIESGNSHFGIGVYSSAMWTSISTSGAGPFLYFGGSVKDGAWHHVAVTYDSAAGMAFAYVDGAAAGSAPGSGTLALTSEMTAGAWAGNNSPFFNGSMDELRFSNSARSPAWIATEFTNENSPGTFFSLGAQQ